MKEIETDQNYEDGSSLFGTPIYWVSSEQWRMKRIIM